MKVQLVTLDLEMGSKFTVSKISDFSSPKSFDTFDVNIIDLRSEKIYQDYESNGYNINYLDDFHAINKIIIDSKKTKFLFIYPGDIKFSTGGNIYHQQIHKKPIKHMLPHISQQFSSLHKELGCDFSFEITKQIGEISKSKSGWALELNMVSWGGREPKFDLRSWAPDHQKMGKGVTLTQEDLVSLKALLNAMEL